MEYHDENLRDVGEEAKKFVRSRMITKEKLDSYMVCACEHFTYVGDENDENEEVKRIMEKIKKDCPDLSKLKRADVAKVVKETLRTS